MSNIGLALLKHADRCKTCSIQKKKKTEQLAKEIFIRMLKKDQKSIDGLLGLATLYYYQKNKKAIPVIRRVIRLTNNQAFLIHIGHFYRRNGDVKKAERYYRKALPFIKKHYGGFYALAVLYRDCGKPTLARRYAKMALAKFTKMDAHYAADPIVRKYRMELKEITKAERGSANF